MTDLNKPRHLENINCLIVDDDKFARNFTKTALFQIGMKNIREAASAAEAEDILKTSRVDLLFTDQQMPEKTGLEMIEGLLKSDAEFTKNIPVIMITSDTRETTVLKAKELHIREYIVKPVSPGILKKRIFNILNIEESGNRD
ncbi:MAG: response regulator [Alphaproteobacteria bacterium]|nr:response regulator [Alphaproteobacteria bacterium]